MTRPILWILTLVFLGAVCPAKAGGFAELQNELDRKILDRTLARLRQVDSAPHVLPIEDKHLRVKFFAAAAGEDRWVMIENSDQIGRAFALSFDKRITVYETSPVTGIERRRGRFESFSLRLRPGAAALLRIQPREERRNMKPKVMLNPSVQYANVVLDDTGAEIYNEGETMWDIAERVKAILDADGHVDAYLSRMNRHANSSIQLECELSQQLACDAFVALHSDATSDGTEGGGSWTFFSDDEGKRLGECVQGSLLKAIREVYPDVQDKGVKEHWNRLYVLHNSGCPASLTEILFHSNPREREMLKDPAFQDRVAQAVAKGILNYFGVIKAEQPQSR